MRTEYDDERAHEHLQHTQLAQTLASDLLMPSPYHVVVGVFERSELRVEDEVALEAGDLIERHTGA